MLTLLLIIAVVAAIPFLLSIVLVWATEREKKTPSKVPEGLCALYLACAGVFLLLVWHSGRGLLQASSFNGVEILRFLLFVISSLFLFTLAFPGRAAVKFWVSLALMIGGGVVSLSLWSLDGYWRWGALVVAIVTLILLVKTVRARNLGRSNQNDPDIDASFDAPSGSSCSIGGDCSGGD